MIQSLAALNPNDRLDGIFIIHKSFDFIGDGLQAICNKLQLTVVSTALNCIFLVVQEACE